MRRATERTFFYALPPLGLYSPQVECLRSYIERLALAHQRMPRDLIGRLLLKDPLNGYGGTVVDITDEWAIHSDSPMNLGLLSRFVNSTRQNLTPTSMGRFGHAFSMFDLLDMRGAERVRFCPLCFLQDTKEGLPYPYGRLLWLFKGVNCCPEHGCYLQASGGCWRTGGKRLALQQRPRAMGICPDCGSIGRQCSVAPAVMATEQELCIARCMAQVLAMTDEECAACNPESVLLGVREAIRHRFKGQYVHAAKAAGLGRGTMTAWFQGTSGPGLASLTRLAIACNVNLSWMLRGSTQPMATNIEASEMKRNFTRRYERSEVSDEEVVRLLAEVLQQTLMPSLAGVARLLGVRVERLSRKFPVQSRAIMNAYREQEAARRQRAYSEAVQAYSEAATTLHLKGTSVTPKNLQKSTGLHDLSGRSLRGRAMKEVLRSAKFAVN